MTAVHTDTTHDCSDDYCPGRDTQGNVRMSGGRGRLIANADHTIADVTDWFRMSKPGAFREDYRHVLRFMRREAGAPDAKLPVHGDERPEVQITPGGSPAGTYARAPHGYEAMNAKQQAALDRMEAECKTRWNLHPSTIHYHFDEPARFGYDPVVRATWSDGERLAQATIDRHGNGDYWIADLDLIHNGHDDECDCKHCKLERDEEG